MQKNGRRGGDQKGSRENSERNYWNPWASVFSCPSLLSALYFYIPLPVHL